MDRTSEHCLPVPQLQRTLRSVVGRLPGGHAMQALGVPAPVRLPWTSRPTKHRQWLRRGFLTLSAVPAATSSWVFAGRIHYRQEPAEKFEFVTIQRGVADDGGFEEDHQFAFAHRFVAETENVARRRGQPPQAWDGIAVAL